MSVSHKSSSTQIFRLMVYRRPLHPELFDLQNRRMHHHSDYEVETWVAPACHVVRFLYQDQYLSETVLEGGDHLPETGLVHALPCLGEKDYEMEPQGPIAYVTTIQTETLTENLYQATYREMQDFAQETAALFHEWTEEGETTPSMTLIDTQKFKNEFHIQSYHLVGSNCTVLRTQSIFEITG